MGHEIGAFYDGALLDPDFNGDWLSLSASSSSSLSRVPRTLLVTLRENLMKTPQHEEGSEESVIVPRQVLAEM